MKKSLVKEEESDIRKIFNRIKKRDFSGTEGIVIKNSIYQLSTSLITKIFSIVFTIVLARMLLPELFGLYGLALSTILIFVTFSDLGIGQTVTRFVSREFGKKHNNLAKSYALYLAKLKFILVMMVSFVLLISAKFISESYYQKPIFLALLAGILYIFAVGLVAFLQSLLHSLNNFKGIFYREIIFQISRIILVPLAILFALKYSFNSETILFWIISLSAFAYLVSGIYLLFVLKTDSSNLVIEKTKNLKKSQKVTARKFLLAVAATSFSGVFFSNIDTVMLGHFVLGDFIGYYRAASSFVTAIAPLTGFLAVVLLPIFSRLKKSKIRINMNKAVRLNILFTAPIFLFVFLTSGLLILFIYGSAYELSGSVLRLFSPMIVILPLIAIYQTYFVSRGKPQIMAKLLIIATLLNILLNYILITSLLNFGQIYAVYGATIATLISNIFYLSSLIIKSRKS